MGIASSGLISGINSDQLISQLIDLERAPIKTIQTKQKDYQLKIATFLDISSKLSSFKLALDALNSSSKFNVKSASVTNSTDGDRLLSVSASSTALAGSHSIKVNQLASASSKASQGWVDQNTTAISSSSGTFKFKVGAGGAETSISVSTTMTLQGLRDAINSSGSAVTASIINDGSGSNPYHLVLSANATGSSNTLYITQDNTNLGFFTKKIKTVSADTLNSYNGTVTNNAGYFYTGTDNKTYTAKITSNAAPGTATYEYATDGATFNGSPITTKTLSATAASQYTITSGTNDKIYFNYGGTDYTATIAAGAYSADGLATAVQTAMQTQAGTYTVAYSETTGRFKITDTGASNLTLKWSNSTSTAAGILGFDTVDSSILSGSSDTGDFVGGMFIDDAGIANSTNRGIKIIFGTTYTVAPAVNDKFTIDGEIAASKKIESIYSYTTNSYAGTVTNNSGDFYTGTDNKSHLAKITTSGATGTAKYKYSSDGGITWGSEITTRTLSNAASQYTITNDSNDKIYFKFGNTNFTADITNADNTYSADGLATAIKNAMETAISATYPGNTFTVTYDSNTGKFTIKNDLTNTQQLTLKWSDSTSTAAGILGFDTSFDSAPLGLNESDIGDFVGGMFIDGAGIANTTNGNVKMIFGTSGTLALDDKFSTDVYSSEMQTAQDAVITVGNSTITKSSNTITDAIQGITMNLLKADSTSTLTLSVSSDTSDAKTNIKSFVDAYNTIMQAINTQLSYDTSTKKKNPLLGDATLQEIRRKIANTVTGAIPGISTSSYASLSQIGITSDSKTGKLSLDDTKVSAALSADPDAVAKMFIGTATATNAAVSFLSKTAKTQAGTYSISVGTAPEKAVLTTDSDGEDRRIDLSSNSLLADEKITFKYSTNKTDVSPIETAFSVVLVAGSRINTIVNTLNSAFATNSVGLSASNDSGKLKITASSYGADFWFQALGQKWNDSTYVDYAGETQQIWTTTDSANIRNDAGVDIAGSINNHNATGSGNVLTSASGFEEDGLSISVDSNETGGFGYVSVSSGVSDRLSSSMEAYTNSTSGLIIKKTDSIQKTIDNLTAQQKRIESRLADKQKRLQDQFTRLEVLLAKYNTTSQYLTGQLEGLSKNWLSNT